MRPFCCRQTDGPHGLVRQREQPGRLDVPIEGRDQPAVDGRRRPPCQLLVDDGLDQAGEVGLLKPP